MKTLNNAIAFLAMLLAAAVFLTLAVLIAACQ